MRLERILHVYDADELKAAPARAGEQPIYGYSAPAGWMNTPEPFTLFLYPDGFMAFKPMRIMGRCGPKQAIQILTEKAHQLGLQPRLCSLPQPEEPVCPKCGLLMAECGCLKRQPILCIGSRKKKR